MEDVTKRDIEALVRDKYGGNPDHALLHADLIRLASGEPLAYVIGWIPFLGLRISLDSRPLITRPETEHWTEQLIAHLRERFGTEPFTLLDLCAGSGAIGLAVLASFPNARVSFGDVAGEHLDTVRASLRQNDLDDGRSQFIASDLFSGFSGQHFDVIATNPPYIPDGRELPESVTKYEPSAALFAGSDGLSLIRHIAEQARAHLNPGGELWLEGDILNVEEAAKLLKAHGAHAAEIRTDQYGRPRLVVAHY